MTYHDLYDDTYKRRPPGGLAFKLEIWQRWKRWRDRRQRKKAELEERLAQIKREEEEFAGWFKDHRRFITKDELRDLLTEELKRRNE